MIKTRLQKELEEIDNVYDGLEEKLKVERRDRKNKVWQQHIILGTLVQDLKNT